VAINAQYEPLPVLATPPGERARNSAGDPLASGPELTPAGFARVRSLAHEHFGLNLKAGKQALVSARLRRLLLQHGCAGYLEYCDLVLADRSGTALTEMGDALSTNFTSFMREPAHFEFLVQDVVPRLSGRNTIDIWSAASSTGEEPYSVLFTLLEKLGPNAPVRVLATDLSTRALAAVAGATYSAEAVMALPRDWAHRYFLRGNGRWDGWYRVKPEFRERVTSRRFNLLNSPLPETRFAVVLCRNVMIYFDKPTQQQVVMRLTSTLEDQGTFLIGHSESLTGVQHNLEYLRPAIYRKSGGRSDAWRRSAGQ
jgi:chemotaxis protein methyltransferase CheR